MTMPLNILEYTEVDGGSDVTVNYLGTVVDTQTGVPDNRVTKDYGAGYFSGGFSQRGAFKMTAITGNGWEFPAAFKTTNENINAISGGGAGRSALLLASYTDFRIYEILNGTPWTAIVSAKTTGTQYYYEVHLDKRTGTYGTLVGSVYSDASRTTLVGTNSLTLHGSASYRYHDVQGSLQSGSAAISQSSVHSDIYLVLYEDLSKYTEVDPSSRITVSGDSVTGAGLVRDESAYIYKDFGANYFSGNFTFELDVKGTNGVSTSMAWALALTNDLGDPYTLLVANKPVIGLSCVNGVNWDVREYYGGAAYNNSAVLTNDTQYYVKFVRDESAGSFGVIYGYIYSNSARTTLVTTLTLALHAKVDFRYLLPISSQNSATVGNSITIVSKNIAIIENHKFEDFTMWTEVDGGGYATVAANNITVTGMPSSNGVEMQVRGDYGAGHFNGNFYHEFTFKLDASAINAIVLPWNMKNATGAMSTSGAPPTGLYWDGVSDWLMVQLDARGSATHRIFLGEKVGASKYWSAGYDATDNTQYYSTIIRDESVGTYGTLYLYVYSNAARTTLVTLQTVTLHQKADFRYLSAEGFGFGYAATYTGALLQNLDINEPDSGIFLKMIVEYLMRFAQMKGAFD